MFLGLKLLLVTVTVAGGMACVLIVWLMLLREDGWR